MRFLTDDTKSYNVLAEMPGTDLKDEVVLLGAHLDSWHTAPGATDNADVLLLPHTLADLQQIRRLVSEAGTAFTVIGNGSNLLAASISEAMNCTAFGLMVAVPLLFLLIARLVTGWIRRPEAPWMPFRAKSAHQPPAETDLGSAACEAVDAMFKAPPVRRG